MSVAEKNQTKSAERANPRAFAEMTLDLIEKYHCTPTPRVYEVFFGYASNHPEGLREQIDTAAGPGKMLRSYDLDRIYHDNFRSADGLWEQQEKSSERAESTLVDAMAAIQAHDKSGAAFETQLKKQSGAMESAADNKDVDKILRKLLAQTGAVRRANAQASTSLTRSCQTIDEVRSDLRRAREDGLKDELTGLFSRRGFETKLREERDNAITNGLQLGLCLMDIDSFDVLTESHGHATGDAVIRAVGRSLKTLLTEREIICRYGDVEFAIIMPGSNASQAHAMMTELSRALARKTFVIRGAGTEIGPLTGSFGLSLLKSRDTELDILDRAHDMLGQAKTAGGNQVMSDTKPMI